MLKHRKIYTVILLIIFLIASTHIYGTAAPEDCDDGTGASMQPGEQNPLDCGAETPVVNPTGACVSGTSPYEVNNGCTPFTLYQKTGDEDWTDVGSVSRTFNHSCNVTNDCDDPVEIKVVDSQAQESGAIVISSSGNYNPIVWDHENSSTDIAQGGTAQLYVSGGVPQYLWSVGGSGFYFDAAYTLTEVTGGANVTLYADDSSCGAASISVTDFCGNSTNGSVRGAGQWTGWYTVDQFQGGVDCETMEGYSPHYFGNYSSYQKQTDDSYSTTVRYHVRWGTASTWDNWRSVCAGGTCALNGGACYYEYGPIVLSLPVGSKGSYWWITVSRQDWTCP